MVNKSPVCSIANIDIAQLLSNNYLIICDTNVYLGLYRFSPDFSNFALACLRKIQDYIVYPYTVKIEFNKHHKII